MSRPEDAVIGFHDAALPGCEYVPSIRVLRAGHHLRAPRWQGNIGFRAAIVLLFPIRSIRSFWRTSQKTFTEWWGRHTAKAVASKEVANYLAKRRR